MTKIFGICLDLKPETVITVSGFLLCNTLKTIGEGLSQSGYSKIYLFLKGPAVLLECSGKIQRIVNPFLDLGLEVEILYCSSALKEYEVIVAEDRIAGLGTWVELCLKAPTFDFTAPQIIQSFICITSSPDHGNFNLQLDLALASALFDTEPTIVLMGEANQVKTAKYLNTANAKKLDGAKHYGVIRVVHEDVLSSLIDNLGFDVRIVNVHNFKNNGFWHTIFKTPPLKIEDALYPINQSTRFVLV